MATLTKTVLGKISGSIGDVTFRQKNGNNYVSSRPNSFTAATDAESVKRRNRFAYACKLSAAMISLAPLKAVWESGTSNGQSAYNKIVGMNYRFVTEDTITSQTFFSPGIGFSVNAPVSEIKSDGIRLTLNPFGLNTGIDTGIEKSMKLAALISLSNPLDDTVDSYALIPMLSSGQQIVLDTALAFSIALSNQESQLFQKYRTFKAMFALVTLDANGNSIQYSTTFQG